MNYLRITGMSCILAAGCVLTLGCSAGPGTTESGDTVAQSMTPGQCNQAVAKDILIAQLVKDSALTNYPLTRLSVDANGAIVGSDVPDAVAGDLEIINSVTEARESVARALDKISGLEEYSVTGLGQSTGACTGIPAWTPSGTTTVNTTSDEIFIGEDNHKSWVKVQDAFSKECPLVKRLANKDFVDPPGDGSTNDPASETVSASGVTANAFGVCPTGTYPGTYCKLSYATGINYAGRTCQVYYGSLRCLLY